MTKWSSTLPIRGHLLCGIAIALSTSMGGCVTQVANQDPTDAEYYDTGSDAEVADAPPPLPDYDQPPCPEDGYVWVPGYWAYQSGDLGGGDYYWVPGAWVQPPEVGMLWTPGYWSFAGSGFSFQGGHWGPHVGFYGGIDYGYGYPGAGVSNVDATLVRSTFNSGLSRIAGSKASYNGPGGIIAGPSALEREFAEEPHRAATLAQQQHVQQATHDPTLAARANGGRPTGTRGVVIPTALQGASKSAPHPSSRSSVPPPTPAADAKPAPDRKQQDMGSFSP